MQKLNRRLFIGTIIVGGLGVIAPAIAAGKNKKTKKSATGSGSSRSARRYGSIKFTTKTLPRRVNSATARRLINQIRDARGRPRLRYRGVLQTIASRQARAMAAKDEMSHHVAGGLPQRARRAGYRGKPAENLARKYETLEEVLLAWLHSPAHRTTMLSERYRYFGLAVAHAPRRLNSKYGIYWAMVLGT